MLQQGRQFLPDDCGAKACGRPDAVFHLEPSLVLAVTVLIRRILQIDDTGHLSNA
jgi:hypothetical protein